MGVRSVASILTPAGTNHLGASGVHGGYIIITSHSIKYHSVLSLFKLVQFHFCCMMLWLVMIVPISRQDRFRYVTRSFRFSSLLFFSFLFYLYLYCEGSEAQRRFTQCSCRCPFGYVIDLVS